MKKAERAPHIAIIGLGQIGGSIGLALRRARVEYEVVGHDREFAIAGAARKRGAIDRAEWNLPAAVAGAGLVIVAVPLEALREAFTQIAPHLATGCVVTDTATVKQSVLDWAKECLPAEVSFVGGDPQAAAHASGIEHADADLFLGRAYCITPSATADKAAVDLVANLAGTLGAQPYFLDPAEHDSFAAAVTHLPFIASAALAAAVTASPGWADAVLLGTADFAETTRQANEAPATWNTICRVNREAILRRLDAYVDQLRTLRQAIAAESGDAALESIFGQVKEISEAVLRGPREPQLAAVPKPSEQLRQMLLGRLGARGRK